MVRIQLASNFQVVELTAESIDKINSAELEQAIAIVNDLGKRVINDIKTAPKAKETTKANKNEKDEEKATPGQIKYLKEKFGIDASEMSKKEAWTTLQKLTKAIED